MKTRNYIVKFFRKAEKHNEKDTYLGMVEIDDSGTGPQLTLVGKAFRQAPSRCFNADLVKVERI